MTPRLPKFTLAPALLGMIALAGWVPGADAATNFDLPLSVPCITASTGTGSTINVPIAISGYVNGASPGLRGFHLTIQLSANLKFSPNVVGAISAGAYLTNVDPNVSVLTVTNTATNVTIDGAITTGTCATAGSGTLFNIVVGTTLTTGISSETVTLVASAAGDPNPSPTLRDCVNTGVTIAYGVASVPVQVAFPLPPITTLAATPLKSGNTGAPAGIAAVRLNWTNPAGTPAGTTVDVYRAPWGVEQPAGTWVNLYPTYTHGALFTAGPPVTPTGNCATLPLGWTKLTATPISATPQTYTDRLATRGYWYYVVCLTDPCGNSVFSNKTTGSLNYLLGDIVDPAVPSNVGDNTVNTSDKAALGLAYGKAEPGLPYQAVIDFGPTADHSVDGRPNPDGFIGFEDLMIYSMNFNRGPAPQFAAYPVAAERDELSLDAPARVTAGQLFPVRLLLKGAGDLQGLSTQLGWDAAVSQPVSVESGDLSDAQDALVLSAAPGNVDAAVMGLHRPGLSGDGVLATVMFRAAVDGSPAVRVTRIEGRDRLNQSITLAAGVQAAPATTAFAPIAPNPFTGTAALAFSVAKPGRTELAIYSVDGRRIRLLASGERAAGTYRLTWDGADDGGRLVPPGLFFARLTTKDGRFIRTLVKVQ